MGTFSIQMESGVFQPVHTRNGRHWSLPAEYPLDTTWGWWHMLRERPARVQGRLGNKETRGGSGKGRESHTRGLSTREQKKGAWVPALILLSPPVWALGSGCCLPVIVLASEQER